MASVLEQIRKLDEQKAALLSQAKQEALGKAQEAIDALNELGFNYRLVQGEGSAPSARTGTRRTGIRDQVLALIQQSDGMARADILKAMDAGGDKKAEQSISNALAALKKGGILTAENGVYAAV